MIPSTSPDPGDEDTCRRAAARLQHDHECWLVLWGCYTRSFVAFPLFPAPPGTVLTARTPADLAARMRRQERSAGVRVPPPSPAPEWERAQHWYRGQSSPRNW